MDLRYSESRVTEDAKFQTLNDILLRYQTDEYLTPARQVKLLAIMNKKVKNLIFSQDMAPNGMANTTVHEHILSLMNVRETIRVHIERASRYIRSMHPDSHNTFRDSNAEENSSKHQKRKRGKEMYIDDKGKSQAPLPPCMICGHNTHDYKQCSLSIHPDRNAESGVPFTDITNGKLWKASKLGGQYGIVHHTLKLDGNTAHTNTQDGKRLAGKQHPIRFLSSNIDTLISSDYLIVNFSFLQSKANIAPDLEEVVVNPPTSTEATTSNSNIDELRALLDSGCLVGDTISQKYRSLFATTLPSEPASIPPFEVNVDKEKWEQFSNRGPLRVQSSAKEAEIRKQVDELLRTKVIEPSDASYYSQVILASKQNDEWQFCIDYRLYPTCKLANSQHKKYVRETRNISFQRVWGDGPNGRIPSSASKPWDPDIPSFYLFLRNISVL
jgi:hypothetical protein